MSEVIVIGLACLYLWYLLAQATILDKPLGWIRDKGSALIMCPWCAGFWITGLYVWAATDYTVTVHLACAGFVGFVGSKI